MTLRIPAPAKVNLSLHITGRREDGYHLLDSLVVFTEFGDLLEITPADDCSLEITGRFGSMLPAEDNLILKAAKLLQRNTGVRQGASIRLHKHIPVGAGLGGGSADAAAALRGLSQLWNVGIADEELHALGSQLGSDVPVCVHSIPCWMRGVGEQLFPFAMEADAWLVLVNPNMPLLTKDVFQRFAGRFTPAGSMPPGIDAVEGLATLMEERHNALEEPATHLLPVIADMLGMLRATDGCRIARMSGSGATCFGLYASTQEAETAAAYIRQQQPDWWVAATKILRNGSGHGKA